MKGILLITNEAEFLRRSHARNMKNKIYKILYTIKFIEFNKKHLPHLAY